MKIYSSAYAAHLQLPTTTLAICWRVQKRNGDVIFGTNHDRNIRISTTSVGFTEPELDLTGTYRASSGILASDIKSGQDMSVDNMEVNGALTATPVLNLDISVRDILSGELESAIVTTFRVNWQDPNDFQDVLRHGDLGQIDWTSDGHYKTEIRGLTQLLQQTIGRTCGDQCDARLGDSRCKFPIDTARASGVVTAVINPKQFNSTLTLGAFVVASPHWRNGRILWLTGDNQELSSQIKIDNLDSTLGHFEIHEQTPDDVQVGDTFYAWPSCDLTAPTCKDVYNNKINRRAPGEYCPGVDAIIRAP